MEVRPLLFWTALVIGLVAVASVGFPPAEPGENMLYERHFSHLNTVRRNTNQIASATYRIKVYRELLDAASTGDLNPAVLFIDSVSNNWGPLSESGKWTDAVDQWIQEQSNILAGQPSRTKVMSVFTPATPEVFGFQFAMPYGDEWVIALRDVPVPFCAELHGIKGSTLPANSPNLFRKAQPCVLPARYGSAGQHIAQWYTSYGASLAKRGRTETYGVSRSYRWDRRDLSSEACRAGDLNHCRMQLTGGSLDRINLRAPVQLPDALESQWHSNIAIGGQSHRDRSLLFDLEHDFGEERFEQFWKSELPVEDAFETAFGIEAGEWMRQWSIHHYGPVDGGPRPSFALAGFSLLFMLACAGIGIKLRS